MPFYNLSSRRYFETKSSKYYHFVVFSVFRDERSVNFLWFFFYLEITKRRNGIKEVKDLILKINRANVIQVSFVAHGPLVGFIKLFQFEDRCCGF